MMRRAGTTQIELIVVMIICAVLSALALPRLVQLRNASSVRAAMTDLGAAFATARQAAITRRSTVAVVFDTTSGVVTLRSGGAVLGRRMLGAGYSVLLGANRDSAAYDPRGLGFGVSNITVTVRRGSFVDTLTM